MKKLIFPILLFTISIGKTFAQSDNATRLATRIAQKMKDSLSLTEQQMNGIYSINIELHNRKMAIREQYKSIDSLRLYFQRIENTRDSLYGSVLSLDQMLLYRQKKRFLINNQ